MRNDTNSFHYKEVLTYISHTNIEPEWTVTLKKIDNLRKFIQFKFHDAYAFSHYK